MLPPKLIRTNRLTLRYPELSDADFMFNHYCRDPEVLKYLTFLPHKTIDDTKQVISNIQKQWEDGRNASYAMCLTESGEMLGMINVRPEGHMAFYGYVIAKKYWNNGYTSEALKFLVNWALDQNDIYRAWTCCDCQNIASAKVMQKAGMTLEGVAKRWGIFPNVSQEPRDEFIYSKSK